jgi:vacuolar-type H+-ATPase subunit I/STV1
MRALACLFLHEMEEQAMRRNSRTKKTTTLRILPLPLPKKKNRRVSSGSSSGRFSVGEADYQTMQSVFKKYNEEKRDEKRRKMDLYERRLALEEKRADDDRAARQMQHEVMMTLIARLNDNNNK